MNDLELEIHTILQGIRQHPEVWSYNWYSAEFVAAFTGMPVANADAAIEYMLQVGIFNLPTTGYQQ